MLIEIIGFFIIALVSVLFLVVVITISDYRRHKRLNEEIIKTPLNSTIEEVVKQNKRNKKQNN